MTPKPTPEPPPKPAPTLTRSFVWADGTPAPYPVEQPDLEDLPASEPDYVPGKPPYPGKAWPGRPPTTLDV